MEVCSDPVLESLFGSRARLLTMAVLANADEPLTGYRVSKIAGVPAQKVYPEIKKGVETGAVKEAKGGFVLSDPDIRKLLQRRVRIRWDEEWDRAREGWDEATSAVLAAGLSSIHEKLRSNRYYLRPKGWKPSPETMKVVAEMKRPPAKDAAIRRAGGRTSPRKDWARGR